MSLRRKAFAGIAVAALAVTGAVATSSVSAHRADAAITCSTATNGGNGPFYPGPDASKVYDGAFSKSFGLPDLSTHTPQGVAIWRNWDGKKHDIFLVVSYHSGQHARIYGITPAGASVGALEIADTHAGGIAVVGNWIYVENTSTSIRKYTATSIRTGLNHRRGYLYVKSVGTPRNVYGASFLTAYGSYLYSGKFNSTGRDKMYAYKVNSNGSLTTQAGAIQVPTKTQGVTVLSDRFIFSTSYHQTDRGNIYVVKRGYSSLDSATLRCFRAPTMNEGIVAYGSYAYVIFEGGSYEYKSAKNRIVNAHKGLLSKLTA